MARVVVTSDLHLGITDAQVLRRHAADIAQERPDLTVLAGDIGEGLGRFRACLDIFRDLPGAVAVLAGNHDVWARHGHHSAGLWESELPEAARAAGMLWLEDEVWRQDGLAVTGSIAWYDYSAAAPHLGKTAEFWAKNKGRWNADARFVDWPWSDQEFAARVGDALVERVAQLEADPTVEAILVVTHVPLYEQQMLRKPHDLDWTFGNAYFGAMTLGERLLFARKLRRVISGHTHVPRDGRVARAGEPVRAQVIHSQYGAPASITFEYP
ncbi:MAG TPA: metallophosphoesterase [Ktedonobacterales bacterium]|nr:metallophosphoesterase [Ktedonobacterales bacterium]